MSLWVAAAGVLAGLGVFLLVAEALPAPPSLAAALRRLDPGQSPVPGGPLAGRPESGSAAQRIAAARIAAALPWLPVRAADLAMLGEGRDAWVARKVALGMAGLAAPAAVAAVAALAGSGPSPALPVFASLACGGCLFFVPDLTTRARAARLRADFRHALTSYLDLVTLERGAGAAPTESLEAAAEIGQGWEFQRIAAALETARRSGAAPWTALAGLASEIGIRELADLADIAEVAGQEGARILATLTARAASMRAEALAADRAAAGSRSTTMVIPVALLGTGFLVLLVFPVVYRVLGAG